MRVNFAKDRWSERGPCPPLLRNDQPEIGFREPSRGRYLAAPAIEYLTKREEQVLSLIGQKLSCKKIAATLGISVSTVRKHRASILRKLGLLTTAQLTAHAITRVRTSIGRTDPGSARAGHALRPREVEVVRLIAHGLTSKDIARGLGISPLTVRKHRENAMRRLGVHSMADLIDLAQAMGLADTP